MAMSNIRPFDELDVTTIVMIADLACEINLPEAFTLLPITKIHVDIPENAKTIKLPHHDVPGSILTAQFREAVRGIVLSSKDSKTSGKQYDYFKNAITINMSVPDKNINLRLAPSSIHMCGLKSDHQAHRTVELLLEKLKSVQDDLDYMRHDMLATEECVNYIKATIRKTEDRVLYMPNDPELNIDKRILKFLTVNMSEHTRVDSFLTELQWIVSREHVYIGSPELKLLSYSMVNYNYSLGFRISRRALSELINGVNGFEINYDNAINHSVKITTPFVIPQGCNIRRKKKKDDPPKHTIMVYESGRVTQSAPSPELASEVYYRFNETIQMLKNKIRKAPRVRITVNKSSNDIGNAGSSGDSDITMTTSNEYPLVQYS